MTHHCEHRQVTPRRKDWSHQCYGDMLVFSGITLWRAIESDFRSALGVIRGTLTAQRYVCMSQPFWDRTLAQSFNACPRMAHVYDMYLVQVLQWTPKSPELSPSNLEEISLDINSYPVPICWILRSTDNGCEHDDLLTLFCSTDMVPAVYPCCQLCYLVELIK